MASTTETTHTTTPGVLTPVLSERYALRPAHAVLCLLFVVVFLVFSYLPLPAGSLWHHVTQGEAIWTQGSLAGAAVSLQTLPLAEGVSLPLAPWLSQTILGAAHRLAGAAGLSTLFTLATFGAVLMLATAFYLQTRRKRLVAAGVLITLALAWGLVSALSVETFGFFWLAALLLALVSANWHRVEDAAASAEHTDAAAATAPCPRWLWIVLPILMLTWANLGTSFLVGAVVIAAWAAGHLVDRARAVGLRSALAESPVRSRIYLAELALAVTLINPYGIDLWLASVGLLPGNWGLAHGGLVPLVMKSLSGVLFAGLLLLAAILLRSSPRRLDAATVILFVCGTAATALHASWLLWFAPVAALLVLPHLAEALGTLPRAQLATGPEPAPAEGQEAPAANFQFAYTLVCGLLIWTGFALSPLATPILGGKPRAVQQVHSQDVPLGVAAWLQQQPTQPSLAWAPAGWADYLAFRQSVPVYAGSLLYALPFQVQNDYYLISRGDNWQRLADRYALDLIVASKTHHPRLATAVRRAEGSTWQLVYEDQQAVVVKRVEAQAAANSPRGDHPQPASQTTPGGRRAS